MDIKHILKTAIALACLSVATHADVLEFNNVDSGAYDSTGFHDPNVQSYGAEVNASRNFFAFDLGAGGISGVVVTSATFRVYTYDANGGFFGNTYEVREIGDVVNVLAGGSGQLATYNAMGSGTSYGTTVLTSGLDNQYIDIELNADAISSLNSSSGLWAMAGTMDFTSIGAEFQSSAFNGGNKLILGTTIIPEPASVMLMGVFSGIGFYIRRRFRS